jgi:hypothetical protein
MFKSDFEKEQERLKRAFKVEGLVFLGIGLLTLLCLYLSNCGGGAAALPFGQAEESTTQPVNCVPEGCAK